MVRRMSSRGVAVLFVSHSIEQILRSCHTVTVARDLQITLDTAADRVSPPEIVAAITGRPPRPSGGEPAQATTPNDGEPVLEVHTLRSGTVRKLSLVLRTDRTSGGSVWTRS